MPWMEVYSFSREGWFVGVVGKACEGRYHDKTRVQTRHLSTRLIKNKSQGDPAIVPPDELRSCDVQYPW